MWDARIVLTAVFDFAQVGDGTTTHLFTPVAVVGLGSGVAMVASGWVRRCFDAAARMFDVPGSGC